MAKNNPYKSDELTMYIGGIIMLIPLTIRCAMYLSKEELAEIKITPIPEDVKQNYLLLIYEEAKAIPATNAKAN